MKTILSALLIAFSAQAFATVTDVMPERLIEPSQGTKVVQINLRSLVGVSCPGSLSLVTKYNVDGFYMVEHASAAETRALSEFVSQLSSECRADFNRKRLSAPPLLTCLSYGFEAGSVYIPVSDAEPVKVAYPINLMVESIVELK